jgi:hypothetical protein
MSVDHRVDGSYVSFAYRAGIPTPDWRFVQAAGSDDEGTGLLRLGVGITTADPLRCTHVTAVEVEYIPAP